MFQDGFFFFFFKLIVVNINTISYITLFILNQLLNGKIIIIDTILSIFIIIFICVIQRINSFYSLIISRLRLKVGTEIPN